MPALLAALLACLAAGAAAQAERIVTAKGDGYTISGLVVTLEKPEALRYGIALFAGHPGILRLREEDGRVQMELQGNFLVRSRTDWLDEETLVLVVDAPSDHWNTFSQWFRASPRYGEDVARLLREIGRRYAIEDWTLVGTSEGSVSAFHAARMNPDLARRAILTASVFTPGKNGPGLSGVDWAALKSKLLWVHHEDDPCWATQYRDAVRHAELTRAPLVTVRGGGPFRGAACMARSQHGFSGAERETVRAMHAWVKTGAAPAEVQP